MKKIVNNKLSLDNIVWLCLLIIVVICRIISINVVPDVICDEEYIMDIISSYIDNSIKRTFFIPVGDGYTTYPYIYPMVFLCRIVGISVFKMRLLQQIITVVSCILVAMSLQILSDNKAMFRTCLFISLTIPWGFVQANRIWDPALVPFYFAIHFVTLSMIIKKKYLGIKTRYLLLLTTFASLVLLAVVYPPCRIPAVGMWIFAFIYLRKYRIGLVDLGEIIGVFLVSTFFSLPLAVNLLNPEFNTRAMRWFVFQGSNYKWGFFLWIKNFATMIGPDFLFWSGDANYRHSIPYFGVVGTASVIPLIACLKAKASDISKYMIFIIILTFLSVSLINEGLPHGLRSCLAWIPFSVLITSGWNDIIERKKGKGNLLFVCIGCGGALLYFVAYMKYYSNIIL